VYTIPRPALFTTVCEQIAAAGIEQTERLVLENVRADLALNKINQSVKAKFLLKTRYSALTITSETFRSKPVCITTFVCI
jgi:glucose-6-phosphate 1-dehydrogenase